MSRRVCRRMKGRLNACTRMVVAGQRSARHCDYAHNAHMTGPLSVAKLLAVLCAGHQAAAALHTHTCTGALFTPPRPWSLTRLSESLRRRRGAGRARSGAGMRAGLETWTDLHPRTRAIVKARAPFTRQSSETRHGRSEQIQTGGQRPSSVVFGIISTLMNFLNFYPSHHELCSV
jgi:hypothetical protein